MSLECLRHVWRMRPTLLPSTRRTHSRVLFWPEMSSGFSRCASSYTLHSARVFHSSIPCASLSRHVHSRDHIRAHLKWFSTSPIQDDEQRDVVSKGKAMVTTSEALVLFVIQPDFKGFGLEKPYVPAVDRLEEAVSLAESITGWQVVGTTVANVRRGVHNRFVFGTGKIAELRKEVQDFEISGVFVNVPILTPLQYHSLKEIFETEVFDRFGIVLQIFKQRAKTREAKVQVEIAEIPFLRSRLVGEEDEGSYDQQRGGTGKMGGAGETSVESARRELQRREKTLKAELSSIRQKHRVSREHRAKNSIPIVAVVGYTNAGKTTLIKALSKDASMEPEDMLFATLDTTMHAGKLPCGLKVLFVDTIGFISDLPHELVESFASTLEDVTSADVLVHVRDVSHPKSDAQKANVLQVLAQLDLRSQLLEGMLEVLNKADKLTSSAGTVNQFPEGADAATESSESEATGSEVKGMADEDSEIEQGLKQSKEAASAQAEASLASTPLSETLGYEATTEATFISATEREGLKELQLRIQEAVLRETNQQFWSIIIPADGPQLSWLHSEATVCDVRPTQVGVATAPSSAQKLEVLAVLSEASLGRLRAKHGASATLRHIDTSQLNHRYKLS